MKKIFAILLLIFLLMNSIGFIAFYYYNLNQLKNEMKSFLMNSPPIDKLELIQIKKSQLDNPLLFKRINDKEIKYKGKLYDVFKELIFKDKILFYGINDKKEEELFANLSNYYNDKFNPKDVFRDKIRNYSQFFFFGFVDEINSINNLNIQKPIIIFLDFFYNSIILDIVSPPPRFN